MRKQLRAFVLFVASATAVALAAPLDSQVVLDRYELALADLKAPKAVIFSYAVSQAGASDIEERHRIYRSGTSVRDETLSVEGAPLSPKRVRIGQRDDRYDITRIAPRSSTYTMLFTRARRENGHIIYSYDVTPIVTTVNGFVVTHVDIDGERFLPLTVSFRSGSGVARGTGELQYGKSGEYWVPLIASVEATVNGKPSRERITWSDYRFPASLPSSTFARPKPVPTPTLPSP